MRKGLEGEEFMKLGPKGALTFTLILIIYVLELLLLEREGASGHYPHLKSYNCT